MKCKAGGWLGLINGSKFQVDFSAMPFPEAFALLRREIEAIRRELGSGEFEQTTSKSNRLPFSVNQSIDLSPSFDQYAIDDNH